MYRSSRLLDFEHRCPALERVNAHALESKFGEILGRPEEVVEMRDGQKRNRTASSSGYVLVQMEMDETLASGEGSPKVLASIVRHADSRPRHPT